MEKTIVIMNDLGVSLEIGTGKKYLYNGYVVEILKKNANKTYSIQSYNEKGKKSSKFGALRQDLDKFRNI